MDESFVCECGNSLFWLFRGFSRCTGCYNEYKEEQIGGETIYWLRRFNNEENAYNQNWEKHPMKYRGELKNV